MTTSNDSSFPLIPFYSLSIHRSGEGDASVRLVADNTRIHIEVLVDRRASRARDEPTQQSTGANGSPGRSISSRPIDPPLGRTERLCPYHQVVRVGLLEEPKRRRCSGYLFSGDSPQSSPQSAGGSPQSAGSSPQSAVDSPQLPLESLQKAGPARRKAMLPTAKVRPMIVTPTP